MTVFLQWGAVVSLLCLIALQSQAAPIENGIAQVNKPPSAVEALKSHGNGQSMNKEEFLKFIAEDLGGYIVNPSVDFLDELWENADKNDDDLMDSSECPDLLDYITQQRVC